MAAHQTALQVYLAIDLLFADSTAPLLSARHKLSQRRLDRHVVFSDHCQMAELILIDFRAQRPTKDFFQSDTDSLTSITPLIPTLLEPAHSTAHSSFVELLYTAHNTTPLNWAASLMLHQVCGGLAAKHSLSSIVSALTPPPNLPEHINPKWWWLLAQSIKILGEYSSKPALELLNKSLQPKAPIQENSLDHPLWAIAFLLHQASKSTVLQDLEHIPPASITTGTKTLLGMLMWLYSPELFPPPWLRNTAKKRYGEFQKQNTDEQQLRLFDD